MFREHHVNDLTQSRCINYIVVKVCLGTSLSSTRDALGLPRARSMIPILYPT